MNPPAPPADGVESEPGDDAASLHEDFEMMDLGSSVENGFSDDTFPHELCSTPAPHMDHAYEYEDSS